jgi:hypothetical protein
LIFVKSCHGWVLYIVATDLRKRRCSSFGMSIRRRLGIPGSAGCQPAVSGSLPETFPDFAGWQPAIAG